VRKLLLRAESIGETYHWRAVEARHEHAPVSETLSRTFADFRGKKLITVTGKTITVHDPLALDALLRRNLGEA